MSKATQRKSSANGSAPSFLKAPEVAELLGVSTKTVRRLLDAGELPFHRFRRSIRISEADYPSFAARHRGVR
jgi:excisionase family DNA binding protein